MRKIPFIILQCTWGLPQTLVGLVFFLIHRRCPHEKVGAAVGVLYQSDYSLGKGCGLTASCRGGKDKIFASEVNC